MATYQTLREFVIERLNEYDPSLLTGDTSRLTALVLNPLIKRLGTDPMSVDIEAFIVARIAEEHPTLDVSSPGSLLRDAFAKPLISVLAPVKREIVALKNQSSLGTSEALTNEELEALLANFFVNRRLGSYAYTTVRVYYSTPNVVSVDASIRFLTQSGVEYQIVSPAVYYPEDMRTSGTLYYIDVPVRSIDRSSSANVLSGTINYVVGLDSVVRCTNLTSASGGVTRETNSALYDRSERALSERSLTKARGIEATLLEQYPEITAIDVVGYGDPEMQRDILVAEVTAPDLEIPGELVYATYDFQTLPCMAPPAHVAGAIPVTNIMRLNTPAAGWNAATKAAVLAAKYIKLLDGQNSYNNSILGRMREIDVVVDDAAGLYVKVKDFEVYPQPATTWGISAGELTSNSDPRCALQQYPADGSSKTLIGTRTGALDPAIGVFADSICGAPLPSADTMVLTCSGIRPGGVTVGRDFLLIDDNRDGDLNSPLGVRWRNRLNMWPITALPTTTHVRVGRKDSYVTDKKRIAYGGTGVAAFSANQAEMALADTPFVVACGCPAYNEAMDADRFNGTNVDAWTSNSGVNLQLFTTAWGVYVGNVATQEHYAELSLHTNMDSWADQGVQVGDFISCATFESATGAGIPFRGAVDWVSGVLDGGMVWHSWGKIESIPSTHTLRVVGLDLTQVPAATAAQASRGCDFVDGAGNGYFGTGAGDRYRVAWTAYRNRRERVSANGYVYTSYDDHQFVASNLLLQYEINFTGIARAVARSGYHTNAPVVPITGFDVTDTSNFAKPTMFATSLGYYLRLQADFLTEMSSLGSKSPAEVMQAPNYLGTTVPAGWPAIQSAYLPTKYAGVVPTDMGSGAVDVHPALVSLPAVEGALVTPSVDTYAALDVDTTKLAELEYNGLGHAGFLMPYPFGGTAQNPTWDAKWHAAQVYAGEADLTASDYKITVSGMPGSVPYPEAYETPVEIDNNEIHIGGIVDVHIKASQPTTATTSALKLSPKSLDVGDELVLVGTDGRINLADPTIFVSPNLAGYISSEFVPSGSQEVALDNLVLEILTADISPNPVRLACNHSTGAVIDGTFGIAGTVTGIHYRVHAACTTELIGAKVVVQTGSDLSTTAGSRTVTLAGSGVTFAEDPTAVPVYLYVDEDEARGEYLISSKAATTLVVASAISATIVGGTYRIYTKQDGAVRPALVRERTVRLANGGTIIPYRHPIEIQSSTFAGLNDDPLTDEDITGTGTLTGVTGSGFATFEVVAASWASQGVLVGDVIYFDSLVDPDRHFYVTEISGDILTLDRVTTSALVLSNPSFTIGHPAVGTATVTFKDPTLFEVTSGDATFSYTAASDAVVNFRPSPAEFAVLYTNPTTTSDIVATPATTRVVYSGNLLTTGVRVGDRARLITQVLTSTAFATNSVNVAGQILSVNINDTNYTVKFNGTNPLRLNDVAVDLNNALGNLLYVTVTGAGPYYLEIYSRNEVEIQSDGTSGVVATLGLSAAMDNTPNAVGRYDVTGLDYDVATDETTVTLGSAHGLAADFGLCMDFERVGTQQVFPAGMTVNELGLYTAEIKLTSWLPLTDDSELPTSGQAMDVEGHTSLGYELVVGNSAYAFSTAEELDIRMTSVILTSYADSMIGAIPLPSTTFEVVYDYSPTVASVQSYMQGSERNLCQNPLVQHYFPAYPAMYIQVGGGVSTTLVFAALRDYFARLYPNKPAEVYDIASVLTRLGVTRVVYPQTVAFVTHDEDRRMKIVRSDDRVELTKRYHIMEDLTLVVVGSV